MATIPLSWNDPSFSGLTNSNSTEVKNGGTLSNYSSTDNGDIATVLLDGAATLNDVRVNSREGVRIGGSGDINISNSYIQTTGLSGDHADGIQAYDPGGHGNITISNTTIVSGSDNATAGLWIADQYSATVTLNNVVFEGGPYGLRIADDAGVDDYLSLNNVYFVGPFNYGAFLLQEVNANIHITAWNNVRYATIVNGVLVPGALIAAPWAVEGGGTPPPTAPTAPVITSGDHVTNDNTVTVSGTAAAGSTITVFDGTAKLGTTTVGTNGTWSYTTAALTDGTHSLTATDTVSGQTSASSPAAMLTIDTKAPAAPVLVSDSVVNTNHVLLSGTAEANSTVTVYDGTTVVGTATASANGSWSVTTTALSTGSQVLTATATDAAGNTSAHSAALDPVIGPSSTPSAPVITSGDHVTNDNTVTVSGTAAAGSAVTVFDGATKLGTTTVGSNGTWSYTTTALTDGKHSLTATDTVSGQTSASSSAATLTIDTKAPAAPVLTSDSVVNTNHVLLSGTAEANSTVTVYDGSTAVGTVTAGANGAWSVTTTALSTGSQILTATATDAAGNTSAHSAALDPVIGPSSTPTPSAPVIASYSNDTGLAGDHITSDNTLALTGTAAANTTVTVFDGTAKLGTATADGSGAWHYVTVALNDGSHSLMATDTDASGHTSVASSALAVTIDTHAPAAPTLAISTEAGKALLSATVTTDDFLLTGTAEANSTVHVFDGGKQIGTATATSNGLWSFDTGQETDGSHSFTSTATDAAGNVSTASAAKNVMVDAPTPALAITNLSERHHTDVVTITGTADANSQVKVYDGTKAVGTVQAGANGTWTYTSSAVTNTTHTYSAQELDSHGHVVASSGNAILGTTGANTLTSTSGNDLFVGHGHPDTFVFSSNFGNDIIKDFNAAGWSRGHDVIEFSKSVFDSFADVLSHATQSGQNVVISDHAGDTLTLNNVKLSALDKHDFHFA